MSTESVVYIDRAVDGVYRVYMPRAEDIIDSNIRVSGYVKQTLKRRAKKEESYDCVLRRLLGLRACRETREDGKEKAATKA